MNEEKKTVPATGEKAPAVNDGSFLASYVRVRCVLFGTPLCPHPGVCSGYDNRMCDEWLHHSGK